MNPPIILSTYTVNPLLQAMEKRQRYFSLSPDLGLSTIQVILEGDFIVLPDQRKITKQVIQHIFEDKQSCFIVGEEGFEKIAFYSDLTDRYYSLYPTSSAPTMLLSGIPMHRIKDTDPFSDTMTKIKNGPTGRSGSRHNHRFRIYNVAAARNVGNNH
jgi:predicted methyltransferase